MNFPALTPRHVGDVLRGFRVQRGLTQAQLAHRLALTQKAISIAETYPERLTLDRLFDILAALEVQLYFEDKRERPASPKAEW